MFRSSLIALAATVTLAFSAGPAEAGTVTAKRDGYTDGRMDSRHLAVRYTAAPGELNDLGVSVNSGALTVTDSGAAVEAGDGCTKTAPDTVRCESPNLPITLAAALGDGDDVLSADATSVVVEGGAGDDRLSSAGAVASLFGGDGDDTLLLSDQGGHLTGGSGRDTLTGGAGADLLVGDGPGAAPADDEIDGGGGFDATSYGERTTPVRVDLTADAGGGTGEHDTLKGIENLTGGDGADVLIGDDGVNRINTDNFAQAATGSTPPRATT